MSWKKITGDVRSSVTLGENGYGAKLDVTSTGEITPETYGASAIYGPANVRLATVTNNGVLAGAYGGASMLATEGGNGIDLSDRGKILNNGSISGGEGGYNATAGFAGGAGISLQFGGDIVNAGIINGGLGGRGARQGGQGGAGVRLNGGNIANSGMIAGGAGGAASGYGYHNGYGGSAGVGAYAAGGASVTNSGTIIGGHGATAGYTTDGGVGVQLESSSLNNSGLVLGGNAGSSIYPFNAGGAAITMSGDSAVANYGTITGGNGGYGVGGGDGGIGVDVLGGVLSNQGAITGGHGSYANYFGGKGGVGVMLQSGELSNAGMITGGVSGGYAAGGGFYGNGGAALYAEAGSNVVNHGVVAGGAVYAFPTGANANGSKNVHVNYGNGGAGLIINGAAVTNYGVIEGGLGGTVHYNSGGSGGAGVVLKSGTLISTGTIIGGSGIAVPGCDGGVGVAVTGGTLIASGTITGGASGGEYSLGGVGISLNGGEAIVLGTVSGNSNSVSGVADAVYFGSDIGTLLIDPGAMFNGAVAASSQKNDLLVLGGSGSGTLSGLGSEFTGFKMIQTAANSDWVLSGTNALVAGSNFQDAGTLSVTTSLADAGTIDVASTGVLNTGTNGAILAAGITMQGGRLTDMPGGTLVVGTSLNGANNGTLSVQLDATISGSGIISADTISVAGALVANGGTLTLHGATTGTGTATIAGDATLLARGELTLVKLDFAKGAGTLALGNPTEFTTPISGFESGDVVDLQKLIATTFTFVGGTLSLLDGGTPVGELIFDGKYTASDFNLTSDGNGGTEVTYAPPHVSGANLWDWQSDNDTHWPAFNGSHLMS